MGDSITSDKQTKLSAETPDTNEHSLLRFTIQDSQGDPVVLWKKSTDEIVQWVEHVPAVSSSYNSGWEATCLIGAPRVFPRHGDIRGAWAARSSSGTHEWLELQYETPVFVTGIDIFETYNPGHVSHVYALVCSTYWIPIWSGTVQSPPNRPLPQSRIFSPEFQKTTFETTKIRIEMDCTTARSWCEIDCVLLRGVEKNPWSPKFHERYPRSFRAAVTTFLLVGHRFNLHNDVLLRIVLHLASKWEWTKEDAMEFGGKEFLVHASPPQED